MAFTKFGPGTLTYTISGGTAVEFAQEVKGVTMSHSYETSGDPVTYLDGSSDLPGSTRADGITAEVDMDLTETGFYNFCFVNDGQQANVVYVPNTVDGASWSGIVQIALPEDVAAESFGSKISGSISHQFVGAVAFTPAGVQAPLIAPGEKAEQARRAAEARSA